MRRLTEFLRLGGTERLLIVYLVALLALIRLALWTRSFRRVRDMAQQLGERPAHLTGCERPRPEQLAWMVDKASEIVPRATCLTRALAAQVILRRFGYPAVLRLGVARSERQPLDAHAWVECDGQVVIGRTDGFERYARLSPMGQAAC